MHPPFEQFPALSTIGICRHVFIQRIPGIDVSHDKAEVLERLDAAHRKIRNETGFDDWPLFIAEQIHGNEIAVIDKVGSAIRADRGRRGLLAARLSQGQRGRRRRHADRSRAGVAIAGCHARRQGAGRCSLLAQRIRSHRPLGPGSQAGYRQSIRHVGSRSRGSRRSERFQSFPSPAH